jgi:predicted DNA-binding protein
MSESIDQDFSAMLLAAQPDPTPAATTPPRIPVSTRLPLSTYEALRAEATRRGVGHTTLMQQLIEEGLAAAADAEDVLVPVSAIREALAGLAIQRGTRAPAA